MNSIEQDAARYRWLRDTQNKDFRWTEDWEDEGVIDNIMVCMGLGTGESPKPDELDAYIDAAMQRWPNAG